jgi:hypothetical protein
MFDNLLHVYFGDSGGTAYTYDGSSLATAGVARPDVSGSSSSAGAAGAVRGIVKYFLSYSDTDGVTEGALSTAFGEVDAGDGSIITLSSIPDSGDSDKKRLYRTFADGSQPFFLATLDDGTTTYEDNIADVDLGDLPFLHGDPPPSEEIVAAAAHLNRIFLLTRDSILYWSDPGNGESFYTQANGNWVEIQKNDGDYGSALLSTNQGLMIFKKNHLYILTGRTPNTFNLVPLKPTGGKTIGCASHLSVTDTPHGVFFYWKNELYKFEGGGVIPVSQKIPGVLPFENRITALGDTEAPLINVQYLPNARSVVVVYANATLDSIQTWMYDPLLDKWVGATSTSPSGHTVVAAGTTVGGIPVVM